MGKRTFLQNAVILTATSLALNGLSMIFRVYLSGKIGADGMGLYTLVTSVYIFAATVATSGLGLGVTRLVSEAAERRWQPAVILRRALTVAIVLGALVAAGTFLLSDFIGTGWLTDRRTVRPLQILCVELPFLGVAACFSGYFLAKRHIKSSSKWQFFEQIVKMAITFSLLPFFLPHGLEAACCAIVIGSVAGEILACGYCFFLYDKKRDRTMEKKGGNNGIYPALGHICLPIAFSSYFRSGLMALENILIPQGFAKLKGSSEAALTEYGILKGMVMPVLVFPATVLSSFSALLIPEISQAAAAGNREKIDRLSGLALRGTLIYSILTMSVFFFLSEPLGNALYGIKQAGTVMHVLAPVVPLMYLDSMSDSLLKALDEQVASLKYNTAEGISRITLLYALIPAKGITGFIVVVFVSNLLSSMLGIGRLLKITDLAVQPFESIIKPMLAAGTSGYLTHTIFLHLSFPAAVHATLGIMLMGALFFLILSLLGCADLRFYRSMLRRKKLIKIAE